MFKGYEIHKEVVCTVSTAKRNTCINTKCKHHKTHVKTSQSGVEYTIENLKNSKTCLGHRYW